MKIATLGTYNIVVPDGLGYSDLKIPQSNIILLGYFQSQYYAKHLVNRIEASSYKLNSCDSLTIHVRRGDYVNNNFGLLSREYYSLAIQEIEKENIAKVKVFTDDLKAAKSLLSTLLLRWPVQYISDPLEDPAQTLLDISDSQYLIIANSSFSFWSAMLAEARGCRKVIAPSPWFQLGSQPLELLPPTWRVLESKFE